MICDPRFHHGRNPQSMMNSAKVVVHEMERRGPTVIMELLVENVRQPLESAYLNRQGWAPI